jgi:hypothetical protein
MVAVLTIASLAPVGAFADDNCRDTFVAYISKTHHYIEVANGDVYSYSDGDESEVDVSFAPMQDVTICEKGSFGDKFYAIQSMKNGISVLTEYKCNAKSFGC